jgi:starch-binding outer membrane protein, SusD/RagB family
VKNNLQNRYRSILMVVLGMTIMTIGSCKKFLQQDPYNRLSITDVFKDFEGARAVLIGCYDNLRESDYYMRDVTFYADLLGGNTKYSKISNQYLFQTYNFNNDAITNEMRNFYNIAYNTIYRCNSVIENVDNAVDANVFQKNRMLADAKTIRALAHFDLVRIFAQMPNFSPNANHPGISIRDKNSNGSTLPTPISTVKEVYQFVQNELDSAINLYARSISIFPTGNDRTWLSVNAARALQCRVSLYQKDWNKVINLANILITPAYPLLSNAGYVNAWRGKVVLTESIFELAYGDRIAASLGDYYNVGSTTNIQMAATNDLLNTLDANDVRSKANMFTTTLINGVNYNFSKKYLGYRDSANNIRLFRISEVLLSRAEAYAETGNLAAALTDLNLIKKRAWPAAPTFTSTIAAVLLDEIVKERRRELCFEGHYFFDLTRRGLSITRADCSAVINCNVTYPSPLLATPIPNN